MNADRLSHEGFFLQPVELPAIVREQVRARDWGALDATIQRETQAGGSIFSALTPYREFSSIEFIISIRSSRESPDEDGIWHDDGSRVLAFSLSLTLDPSVIEGGRLGIRRRGTTEEGAGIPTPPYGTMIVFATGRDGFEHRIARVAQGERVIIAGWCS